MTDLQNNGNCNLQELNQQKKDKLILKLRQIICNEDDNNNNSHAILPACINGLLVTQKRLTSLDSLLKTSMNEASDDIQYIEYHARNVANVFLNATRIMSVEKYIVGRMFLIGSIIELAVKGVRQAVSSNVQDKTSIELSAMQHICSELNLDFSCLKRASQPDMSDEMRASTSHRVHIYEENNNTANKNTDKTGSLDTNSEFDVQVKFSYHDEDMCSANTTTDSEIQIQTQPSLGQSNINSINFIGQLDSKYSLYLQTQSGLKPLMTIPLLKMIFCKLDNELNDMGDRGWNSLVEALLSQDQEEHKHNINLNTTIQSSRDLELIFEHIDKIYTGYVTVQKFNSIKDALMSNGLCLNSMTRVTVIFFNHKNGDSKGYVPYTIYNTGTRKLNFLAWYSDADETGFMRHSEINEADLLYARLAKHAKMLIYCENTERCTDYNLRLLKTYSNWIPDETATMKNKLKKLIWSPTLTVESELRLIPLINKCVYDDDAQGSPRVIRNIFTNEEELDTFMSKP